MTTANDAVDRATWLTARKQLLAREKALTREYDALAAARRALPRVRVDAPYVFTGPDGPRSLSDLFGGKRQLVVYHFMFDPSWEQGCKSCSFVSDHFSGAVAHLAARDTAFAAISRAPLAKIEAFRARMGWTFPWLSSHGSSFNYDFHVSFDPADVAAQAVEYNYTTQAFLHPEAPGLSVFAREGDAVYHTYSTYGRGLEPVMATYAILDITPLGRQEEGLEFPMAWVRHHDRYDGA
ncbi:Predicted dithiol-disulfide oxidoreductase, DUF899 family [Nannocystis exedens]|uniref:Predicted dithiol-disulfide oxidoreductase, DUF899 family n=1 Tax=Nannocystis exedens TaxID=54 RepID=A0A1I2CRM6_9BACT|nr:DUF899 domain-containing protein [Nannocystis exedens]PCC68516.1 thioredoxin [Nannocystis exedens]SFE71007.1 Predicted dithiol-disulfide oxidoreductase, DUF899 family [Nannocystis exedens]